MTLEEYAVQQSSQLGDPGKKEFMARLDDEKIVGRSYGFLTYKDDQMLEECFSLLKFDVPKDRYEDFKLFFVEGAYCPCILYTGIHNLGGYVNQKGIVYDETSLEHAAAFFEEDPATGQKCIFIKDNEELFDAGLYHELRHLFNSYTLKKQPENHADFIYRYIIDEVDAYTHANATFPAPFQFLYPYLRKDGIQEMPKVQTKKEFDAILDVYFGLFKAFKSGMDDLDDALESTFRKESVVEAAKSLHFDIESPSDRELIPEFVELISQMKIKSLNAFTGSNITFIENSLMWLFEKLKDTSEDEILKQTQPVLMAIKLLQSVEYSKSGSDADHSRGRRTILVNDILHILDNHPAIHQTIKNYMEYDYLESSDYHPTKLNQRELEMIPIFEFADKLDKDLNTEDTIREIAKLVLAKGNENTRDYMLAVNKIKRLMSES